MRLKYTKPGVYIVRDTNGNQYQPNDWDNDLKQPGKITKKKCGENRYIGIENLLEFYLTADCTLRIDPINSI